MPVVWFFYAVTCILWWFSYITYYAFGDTVALLFAIAGGFTLMIATTAHQDE